MKKSFARWGLSGLLTLLTVTSTAASGLLADWQFNERRGTRLTGLTESVSDLKFTPNAVGVATTGDGALRIRRNRATGSRYHAPIEVDPTKSVWMVVEIRGWNLEGDPVEVIRFGLADGTGSNDGVADIRLARTENNQIELEGRAMGLRSRITARPLFANPRTESLTLALEIDPNQKRYRIHYREGNGTWVLFGSARIHAERSVKLVRLNIINHFAESAQEHLDLSRLYVTYDNPVGGG